MAVYIFLDESGNLDFSPQGTRYFCFGCVTVTDPVPLGDAFGALRYALMSEGLGLERFHAAEDRQEVRNRVFDALRGAGGFDLDFLVADKQRAPAALREPLRFYAEMGYAVVEAILSRLPDGEDRIILVTDTLPLHRDRKALAKAFRTAMKDRLADRPFLLVHHASAAHVGLQAADYVAWAVHRKWQRGDSRSYALIREWVRTEREADFGENDGG